MTNTSKNPHLDKTVIRLFVVVFLFSVSLFAYRYTKHKPCEDVFFDTQANEFRAGELIKFIDYTTSAEKWNWRFGDSSEAAITKEPLHIFEKPGEYLVKLMVNDICAFDKLITIKEKLFVIDSSKLPKFTIPKRIIVGQTLNVKDATDNATTWEWNFGESASSNSKKSRAKYVYKEPGVKTISLVVNGDVKHMTKKRITVLPKIKKERKKEITGTNRKLGDNIKYEPVVKLQDKIPEQPKEEVEEISEKPNVVAYITDAHFSALLKKVAEKKENANVFKEYLCGDLNKAIIANEKKGSFLVFCEKIKGKKLKIKELVIYRDKGSNCIKTITIKHRSFGLF